MGSTAEVRSPGGRDVLLGLPSVDQQIWTQGFVAPHGHVLGCRGHGAGRDGQAHGRAQPLAPGRSWLWLLPAGRVVPLAVSINTPRAGELRGVLQVMTKGSRSSICEPLRFLTTSQPAFVHFAALVWGSCHKAPQQYVGTTQMDWLTAREAGQPKPRRGQPCSLQTWRDRGPFLASSSSWRPQIPGLMETSLQPPQGFSCLTQSFLRTF